MLLTLTGCQDDMDTVRKIQAARQTRMQSETKVDHLGEAMSLTSRWIELDPTTASRQVVYHLNAWQTNQNSLAKVSAASDDKANADTATGGEVSQLVRTISELIPAEEADKLVTQSNFVPLDVFFCGMPICSSNFQIGFAIKLQATRCGNRGWTLKRKRRVPTMRRRWAYRSSCLIGWFAMSRSNRWSRPMVPPPWARCHWDEVPWSRLSSDALLDLVPRHWRWLATQHPVLTPLSPSVAAQLPAGNDHVHR